MEGVYMTPASRIIEIGLAVSALVILYFMARIFISKHAWGDGAQYEMLDLPTPENENFDMLDDATVDGTDAASATAFYEEEAVDEAAAQGLIGMEDRIVRIGFTLALSYLSITWFGIRSVAMWFLALPVLYFIVTAMIGRDPIYKALGLSTEFD